MKRIASFVFGVIALAACTKVTGNENYGVREELQFKAYTGNVTQTNSNQEQRLAWKDGDEISIFSSSAPEANEKFVTDDTDGNTAAFSGAAVIGKKWYGVYPYKTENRLSGEILETRIDPEQKAVAGNFGIGQFPAVAVSTDHELQFHNICALISFRIPELGSRTISKVVLKGNKSEKLTGNVKVDLSSETPYAMTDKGSVYKATLTGAMHTGETFHLVTAPQDFPEGLTLTLYAETGESFVVVDETPTSTQAGEVLQLKEFEIETDEGLQKIGETYHIYNADGLMRFAELVNNGMKKADAVLEEDIDMAGISDWIPIGKGTVTYVKKDNRSNTAQITGNAYTGCFDGNGKCIFNLKLTATGAIAGNCYGLFGILDKASIKNLTLGKTGDESHLTVTTSGDVMQETGVLAGLCNESDITDVTNYVNISYTGSSTKRVTIGTIGSIHSDKKQSVLERVINRGNADIRGTGNDTNGWASAIHVGGICGAAFSSFESGNNSANKITFLSYCENYGNISSNAGRTAGIAGGAPYYVVLNSCFNHGTITTNAVPSAYAAGMTVFMSTMSGMQDCINNGNVIATNGAGVSGLVGLCSYSNSNFSACANFGDIISDNSKRGVFIATNNNVASKWMGCTAAGHVGTWNNNDIRYDSYPESLQVKYLGPGADKLSLDGIIYQMGSTDVPTGPEPELRILFIGNSFTQDAVHLLPNLLEGAGIRTVELGLMYWGGSIIQQHDENFYNNSTNFTYYRKPTSIEGSWLQYKGYTLEDAVKEHKWDIITIQEHTGRVQSWVWSQEEQDAIKGLIEKIQKAQAPEVPEIWYIFSQAYHDLTKSSGTKNSFNSTAEHYSAIASQARKVKEEITGLQGIIPTGTVLQNLRGSSLNNDLGLTRDGYHMDYGLSRYAASCAVYEALILKKFPDCTLEKNTWRITQSSEGQTPVTDANRPAAIAAARKALERPFEVSPIE